ncbi:MAG: GHMP kinase [Elusimicrobia bacterium]|nr:GHMP kinase [Elusimicrobiota bacterium]
MIISQTPLRVSLAGGGTDLPGYCGKTEGRVLSTAIDKYIHVIVQERFDDQIHVNYAKRKEAVSSVDEVQHPLAREAMRVAGMTNGFEVTTLADIPSEGSGLGSSSTLTVGYLNAFHAFMGRQVDAETLARQACEIEIERLKKPIGRQDQYIAAYGGLRFLRFGKGGKVAVEGVKASTKTLRELENGLLLYFSGKTRSGDALLAEQGKRMGANRKSLDAIRALADGARAALEAGDADGIGRALDENWRLKRGLAAGVSDRDIDAFYAQAQRHGALGGKVTGAGGGGFFVLYAPELKRAELRAALKGHREMPIALEPDGSKIIFNQKRRIWK